VLVLPFFLCSLFAALNALRENTLKKTGKKKTKKTKKKQDDVGEMESMVWNCPNQNVDAIVITDGSRILGLGDVGLNGLAIPQGKLDLYIAAAGFHPSRVLPVVLDVGCDNAELRTDPFYFGLKRRRIKGDDFFAIFDEVMRSLASRWPNCVVQFEDFSSDRASAILER